MFSRFELGSLNVVIGAVIGFFIACFLLGSVINQGSVEEAYKKGIEDGLYGNFRIEITPATWEIKLPYNEEVELEQ